ncbi:family 78 glycoside hydrolase catalytic domain [Sphingomonas sp. PB2P19]|uniref:alpha-L-rhamnosidase n=1 Tax=Sphingomonas rhamnosi TaxID=3096156 RepID=UPI002FC846DC
MTELSAVDLRTDYIRTPIGIEAPRPRLSWRIEGDGRGVAQASWRVRAATSAAALHETTLLWDSGERTGSASFDIAYDAPTLGSMQRVWWNVEITDTHGNRARSASTWFETGLLCADDWHAQWIEAEDPHAAADRAAALQWIWAADPLAPGVHGFRLDFTAPYDLVAAEVMVTAKDHLRGAWINGEAATLPASFGWGTLIPVNGAVRPGANSLCIAAEADTEGFFPVDGGAVAALVRLHRRDGSVVRLVSDSAWRVTADPPEGWTDPAFHTTDWPMAGRSGSAAAGDPRPPEPAVHLRHAFNPRSAIVGARLYATALGAYEARINGTRIGDGLLAPEISVAQDHVLYQCHDVTDQLVAGENVLGFTVADGFYAGAFGWRMERYGFGPAPRRMLAQLRLDLADGTTEWIVSGPDWTSATGAIFKSDIYGGEHHDARLEPAGWDRPGFDDTGWRAAPIGATPNGALIAQVSPPLRPLQTLVPQAITEPSPGRFVADFGQNFSGHVRLCVAGYAGGVVTLRFAELLDANGHVDQANLRLSTATDRYVLRGDPDGETWEPRFTYHGFRYVELEAYPGTPSPGDVQGIVVHSDCGDTGTMTLAHPLLQRIWANALWSQRSNFFAVPTDCPQRDERMGWMGDIQVFLDAAAFNMDVDPFIRRFLLEARAAQRPDGAYPIVVPQPLSFPDVVTAGWSEAGIILPHGLWQRYGDTAAIDENWAAMERWMAFVARDNPDHVWRHERGLDLGDWLSVDAIKPDDETTARILCATAYWAWCAQLMREMAEATGRTGDAARYAAIRETIGAAFATELVDADGRAGNGSQTSQVLALFMNLVPTERRDAAAQLLADDIRGRGMTLSTGFLGTPYLLDVLADADRWDEVAGLLLQTRYPSWGYMPSVGATTVWERWNGDVGDLSMNSYNHYAFGAVVGFFYRRLAGIAAAAPGFRRIAVRPHWLPQVGRVEARYDSVVGTIATIVDGDDRGLSSLSLTVPANAVADIELPADDGWVEGGHRLNHNPDIRDLAVEGALLRCTVGSGTYRFTR